MAADIFISFASKDIKVATTLCSALESRGFSCWIAARDIEPGENFQISIVRALRRARIMLLVFTANSNTSEEMTKELALASQQKIMVIPLRVEDVTPNDAFAYEFATRQWIDAFADWESSIDQLSRRVAFALQGESHAVSRPPAVVAEPEVDEAPALTLEEAEPAPAELATARANIRALARADEPAPEAEPVAEAAPVDEPDLSEEPKPRRRLLIPVALAAGVAIAVAVAASSFLQPGSPSDSSLAATSKPRLAPALVVQPLPPSNEVLAPPAEEAPKLVKSANRPKPAKAEAAADDIPY